MNAVNQSSYGSPEVLNLVTIDRPDVGPTDVLVRVHASPVTQGDRRLRSADFPGISWLPGRLMMGLFRPKNPIPGTMYAGEVVAVGHGVKHFSLGDLVFGETRCGAHAEYIAVSEDSAIATQPKNLSAEEAAAVPYGAVTALVFLKQIAAVQPGERVLVIGASGGVGHYAVQLARHLGAEVTGVCSAKNHHRVRALGAAHVIDYATQSTLADGQEYDVVLDTIGAQRFGTVCASLAPGGRYLSLIVSVRLLLAVIATAVFGRKRALFGVAIPSQQLVEDVRDLVEQGVLHPTVDKRFPLRQIAQAHAYLESGQSQGCVVVTV